MDLQSLNEYLKSVLDMIPPQSYFQRNNSNANAKGKGKKRKLPNKKTNDGGKVSQKSAKKAKLSPSFMKTTSARITDNSDSIDKSTVKRSAKGLSEPTESLTALQKRLKDKITEIQEQRRPKNKTPEEIEKTRAKRKKERVKMKLKAKAKLRQELAFKTGSLAAETAGKPGQQQEKSEPTGQSKAETAKSQRAAFSKLDFGAEMQSKDKKNKLQKKKKLKTLLAQAENKKMRLETLKQNEPEKAEAVIKKDGWEKALQRAEGVKVKDDPELLKKTLKKQQTIKKQHAKKWKEREDKVEEKMKRKQDKRSRNIQARKDTVKQRKLQKRAKKLSKSAR